MISSFRTKVNSTALSTRSQSAEPEGYTSKSSRGWLLQIGIVLVVVVISGCRSKTAAPAPPQSVKNSSSEQEVSPTSSLVKTAFAMPRPSNPGYVGFQECAACHQSRVEECRGSSHFLTCRTPDRSRMPNAFYSENEQDRSLELPGIDIRFEMESRDGAYFQKAVHSASGSATFENSIDLIYGAKNISDEVYLSWHDDDSLWELPVAWVHAAEQWGAAGFDPVGGTHFARELTLRCFECHMTWFEHVPGTLNVYRKEGALLGVTCERCHGPGAQHVEYHVENPDALQSQHIVYPAGLSRERLLDVCIQCHSNSIRHRGPALSFRPGDDLKDHYRTVAPKYEEDDHVADQISDLRESSCFASSEMTCVTCHDPHLTDQPSVGAHFAETCTQCHAETACGMHAELPPSVASACVDCHMRKYVKINVNFDLADQRYFPPATRTKHRIAIDPIATQEVLLKWHRSRETAQASESAEKITSQLLQHWLGAAETVADQGRYTAAVAAIREALRIAPQNSKVGRLLKSYGDRQRSIDDLRSTAEHALQEGRLQEAVQQFRKLIEDRPDDAASYGRLGMALARLDQRQDAVVHLRKAIELDPDDQYGYSVLARLASTDGKHLEAARLYELADQIEPFNAKLNLLWGEALARGGELDQAIERFQAALKSNPRSEEARRSLTVALLHRGETNQALLEAEKLVQLTDFANPGDLMLYAEVSLSAGDREIAQELVQTALAIPQTLPPQLATEIRNWAREHGISLDR